jgi:hypothetical protein
MWISTGGMRAKSEARRGFLGNRIIIRGNCKMKTAK